MGVPWGDGGNLPPGQSFEVEYEGGYHTVLPTPVGGYKEVQMFKKILVCLDGSQLAEQILPSQQ